MRSSRHVRHHHNSIDQTPTSPIGAGQVAWIGVELIYLPEPSVLQLVYGTTGALLALLPVLTSTRDYLEPTPALHSDVAGGEGVRPMTARLDHQGVRSALTSQQVWRALVKASFAVLSHVTPSGKPRSSGVVYWANGHRLFVAVAPDSWKAKQIAVNGRVAVTVPVRRGGLLSLLLPIPPAVIGFHGTATVHPAKSPEARSAMASLAGLLPEERRASAAVVEIVPEGEFVTYGLNVPLRTLRDPVAARGRVAVL